jgi:hypothetical protein
MTAKEKRYVRKLEIRIEELERHFKIANDSNIETFVTLYQTRVAMRHAYEALVEAETALHENMKDDLYSGRPEQ